MRNNLSLKENCKEFVEIKVLCLLFKVSNWVYFVMISSLQLDVA